MPSVPGAMAAAVAKPLAQHALLRKTLLAAALPLALVALPAPLTPVRIGTAFAAEQAPSAAPSTYKFRIEKRKLASGPKALRVRQGERVTLEWLSDEAAALHLHGYNVELTLAPGKPGVMSVDAYAAGRFPIAVHRFGDDPQHGGGHEERVLLYLEVHPR